MKTYKVDKLPNTDLGYQNLVSFSPLDVPNGKRYYRIKNIIYPGINNSSTAKGTVGINKFVRNYLNLAFVDSVDIIEISPPTKIIDKLELTISVIEPENMISLHEEEIQDQIRKYFNDFVFSQHQQLLFKANEFISVLGVLSQTEGKIGKDTKITIKSPNSNLNLIGSELLKRDLFRPETSFEQFGIGGLQNEMVSVFRRALSTRAISPILAEKLGISHVKGILLYGPPGTGKTLIARKIGSMISHKEPKVVNGPEIMDKFVGGSEKNVRDLFSEAIADKSSKHLHVLIFDEIDAICRTRGRSGVSSGVNDSVVNQLLSMIDGVHALNNIFIIAMTNRKDLLDPALLRAGRIEVHLPISLPDYNGRIEIFRIHTNKMKTSSMMSPSISLEELSKNTENYSGAEIEAVVRNATSRAVHSFLASSKGTEKDIIVGKDHFHAAIQEITPFFGRSNSEIKELVPHPSTRNQEICSQLINFFTQPRNFKTCLVYGNRGSGKTTLMAEIIDKLQIKYSKLYRAIDHLSLDEYGKNAALVEINFESRITDNSLIIFDDVEILLQYVQIGASAIFSNKIYQTLITLLKTEPKKNSCLSICLTCGDSSLAEIMEKYVDITFNLDQ